MVLLPIFTQLDVNRAVKTGTPARKESENNKTVPSQPVLNRSASRRMPGKNAFALPSIVDALRKESPLKETESTTESDASTPVESVFINPFSQENLTFIWRNFVENIDAPQLKSALLSRDPVLKEGWQISYALDNELMIQRITLELKPQLLGHLRKNLSNERIEIEFIVTDSHDDKTLIPYTDAEKWQALAEKYPALVALKNKFGLDFK